MRLRSFCRALSVSGALAIVCATEVACEKARVATAPASPAAIGTSGDPDRRDGGDGDGGDAPIRDAGEEVAVKGSTPPHATVGPAHHVAREAKSAAEVGLPPCDSLEWRRLAASVRRATGPRTSAGDSGPAPEDFEAAFADAFDACEVIAVQREGDSDGEKPYVLIAAANLTFAVWVGARVRKEHGRWVLLRLDSAEIP